MGTIIAQFALCGMLFLRFLFSWQCFSIISSNSCRTVFISVHFAQFRSGHSIISDTIWDISSTVYKRNGRYSSAHSFQRVKKASQSLPRLRQIKSNLFCGGACTRRKIQYRTQVCSLSASSGQRARAVSGKRLCRKTQQVFRQAQGMGSIPPPIPFPFVICIYDIAGSCRSRTFSQSVSRRSRSNHAVKYEPQKPATMQLQAPAEDSLPDSSRSPLTAAASAGTPRRPPAMPLRTGRSPRSQPIFRPIPALLTQSPPRRGYTAERTPESSPPSGH